MVIGLLPSEGNTTKDSLWNSWSNPSNSDSVRLQSLDRYIWNHFLFSNPDSAYILANMFYQKAVETKNINMQEAALTELGISLAIQGKYPEALEKFEAGLQLNIEQNDKTGIGNSYVNLGNMSRNQGNFLQALKYFQQSLKIKEELNETRGIANDLTNIGTIFRIQKDYEMALEYFTRSLEIREKINDTIGISKSLNSIGIAYSELGDSTNAINYYTRSMKMKETSGRNNDLALVLINMGNLFKNFSNYPEAKAHYLRSLDISLGMNNKIASGYAYIDLGDLYIKENYVQKGIELCTKAYDIVSELDAISEQLEACRCLYAGYKKTNNCEKTLLYNELILELQDSLNSEETTKQLQQMEFEKRILADSMAQVEKDLKTELHTQVLISKEKNKQRLLLYSGLGILLLAIGLWSRLLHIRRSKELIQKEKDRSDSLLLNILPAEIAEELKIYGKAEARDIEMASILFTDFKEFTEASERLKAKELVSELNICFQHFDQIMEKYGVEKIKTIGDAYMSAGGIPVYTENSVHNTVLAGLEMQEFIAQRKSIREKDNELAFEMRLGIHTGPVVAGIVGVKKFQYDIWGDTVNIAARMESNGEVGKVNISESTYQLIKDIPGLTFTKRGKIMAKGKGEIDMYFVGKS